VAHWPVGQWWRNVWNSSLVVVTSFILKECLKCHCDISVQQHCWQKVWNTTCSVAVAMQQIEVWQLQPVLYCWKKIWNAIMSVAASYAYWKVLLERIPKSRWQHWYCNGLIIQVPGRYLDFCILTSGTFRYIAGGMFETPVWQLPCYKLMRASSVFNSNVEPTMGTILCTNNL
jgi:hypothetical protein